MKRNTPKWLGRDEEWLYVNSACGIGRDRVEELIPDADLSGRVRFAHVESATGIRDVIVGGPAIRVAVEEMYGCCGERARQLLRGQAWPLWHELPYADPDALREFSAKKSEQRQAGITRRSKNLKRGQTR